MSEASRKKVAEHTTWWERATNSGIFSFKDSSQRAKDDEDLADRNIEAEKRAQAEALRKKRMQTSGTGGA